MAWSAPMTAVANNAFTAAQFNTYVRDNLNETAPAKATLTGQIPVATGTNAIAMRRVSSDVIAAIWNTTSTTYSDSVAAGPIVSLTTGDRALVMMHCFVTANTNSEYAFYTFDVSGATTSTPNDNRAVYFARYTTQIGMSCGTTVLVTGLTPGTNVFTAKYRSSNATNTATFDNRRLAVLPF